jgi:iron complex outermembrane receptor protein
MNLKSNISRIILSLIALIITSIYVNAQQITITGQVKNTKGELLQGVSIASTTGGKGTRTDQNGFFKLSSDSTTTLSFTSVGYKNYQIIVSETKMIDIVMNFHDEELDQIVLIGSRSGGRVKTETPIPIDVIKLNQFGLLDAKPNLPSILNIAAPSFNYNKMSASDGADHVDLGTLRGLGPDQTLVLINGKRRHQTAFIGLFGTRGRGNSGTDLNSFPESAIDRVEILRDGASAQYGSDAMAGVINIILKKNTNKWNIDQGFSFYSDKKFNTLNNVDPSQYYTGKKLDGRIYQFSADNGWSIGRKKGSLHLSVNYLSRGKTFRQAPDTNVLKNPEALPINRTRRAVGESSLEAWSAMFNLELPISKESSFYAFGSLSHKFGDSYAFTRNASARPDRFPVDNNGKVIFVPSIMKKTRDGEIFYNPHNQAKILDWSAATGLKGKVFKKWSWDVSNTIGQNDMHFFGNKTFNASLINQPEKTKFDDGGLRFLQNTFNVDINRSFENIGQGLNLGLGAELKYEQYDIYAGEEASYKGYPNPFGQSAGAQGFPGFSATDVIKGRRTSASFFSDAEIEITKSWLVSAAARFENFSDFGFVSTGKLATRIKINSLINWRASVSSGFRAPSLQQIYFNNTITSFSFGQLIQNRIASNVEAITKSAGIPSLKEENSINFSTGFTAKIANGLRLTLDGYAIKLMDRIVLSGVFSANDPTLTTAFTQQLKSIDVASAQFFANAVNTSNFGLDFVADYSKKWATHTLKLSLTGNLNKVNIDNVNVPATLDDSYIHRKSFFSDREAQFLKASAPSSKIVFSADLQMKKWSIGARQVFFGKMQTLGFGWSGLASKRNTGGPGDPAISGNFLGIDPYVDIDGYNDQINVLPEIFRYGAKSTTDVYSNFLVSKNIQLTLGIENLFNVHPDYANVPQARYQSFVNETGGPWESVQMGFNGTKFYGKLKLAF